VRLLLIEDNPRLRELVAETIHEAGWRIDAFATAAEGRLALASAEYDLLLLDLGLPDEDGLDVLRGIRRSAQPLPILILTARGAVDERIAGLDAGADDYLVKPFDPSELEARIRAQLRRTRSNRTVEITVGALAFDSTARAFTLAGRDLALTPRETAVLEALVLRAGRPVRKEALFTTVFGHDDEAAPSAIEIYVHRLRKKLEGSGVGIATLRGLGYVLRVET
jgi:two-component system response regulator QseB/two-component system response regulator TctD